MHGLFNVKNKNIIIEESKFKSHVLNLNKNETSGKISKYFFLHEFMKATKVWMVFNYATKRAIKSRNERKYNNHANYQTFSVDYLIFISLDVGLVLFQITFAINLTFSTLVFHE